MVSVERKAIRIVNHEDKENSLPRIHSALVSGRPIEFSRSLNSQEERFVVMFFGIFFEFFEFMVYVTFLSNISLKGFVFVLIVLENLPKKCGTKTVQESFSVLQK